MTINNYTERLSKCYSSVIHDILRDDGYKNFTLPSHIKPCKNNHVLAGQIFTLFILTVAAAEAAIGLAIIVIYFRNSGTIRVEEIEKLKG